jgi:hypothetical protein
MRSQWFVALVDDGIAFDSVVHRRLDFDPDEINVIESEEAGRRVIAIVTDVSDAGLTVLSEKTWCHVSREVAGGDLVCVGSGFIDPLSIEHLDEDLVSVEVICSPRDWEISQYAALAPLKVLPAYDPILIAQEKLDDPVEILDGYSRQVFCHPVTHAFSTVDILGFGLPLIEIDDPDFPGPQPTGTTRPVARVDVTVTAEWLQHRGGPLSATAAIKSWFEGGEVCTLTPDAFEASWFRKGDTINGDSGYTVEKATLEVIPTPVGRPSALGPVHGSSGIYNYVLDPDLAAPEAQAFDLPLTYYDVELELKHSIAQKRFEIVRFSIENGSAAASGGGVETLDLRCEDVSLDATTPSWRADTAYGIGAVRVASGLCYRCTEAHVSAESFVYDLAYPDGSGGYLSRWQLLETNGSAIGRRDAPSYFTTPRGQQTVKSAMLKARAILASSQRNRPYDVVCELTDEALSWTTAMVASVPAPGAPGGRITGKITSLEIVSNSEDEEVRLTISPASGSGAATTGSNVVTQTGEDWDAIVYADFTSHQPEPLPIAGGSTVVDFDPEDQLEYLQDNDFQPDLGRNDPKVNDPVQLLRDVPTGVRHYLTQLSGRDAMEHVIDVTVTAPWSGPWQYGEQP